MKRTFSINITIFTEKYIYKSSDMESTRNVISNCGESINQIVICLSAIESIEPELIEEGTQLVKSLLKL